MVISHHLVANRHTFRVIAIGLFAFPEPIISDALGAFFLVASFFLPDPRGNAGRASSCGCDYHRGLLAREKPHLGTGALVSVRKPVPMRLLPPPKRTEDYGFVPLGLKAGQPAPDFRMFTKREYQPHPYAFHRWPKLEGAKYLRMGGYGAKTAVKCEASAR
ncbi:MAG: hypothetical protein HYX90_03355 [Chloroflexi bacterium]|nr:hypothetical protein [Chloroflexota bacterium]